MDGTPTATSTSGSRANDTRAHSTVGTTCKTGYCLARAAAASQSADRCRISGAGGIVEGDNPRADTSTNDHGQDASRTTTSSELAHNA